MGVVAIGRGAELSPAVGDAGTPAAGS